MSQHVNSDNDRKLSKVAKTFAIAAFAFLALTILLVAVSATDTETSHQRAAPSTLTQQGNTELSIVKVQVLDSIGSTLPAEGGVFVVIDYKIRNAGDVPIKASDLPQLQLIDAAGVHYNNEQTKRSAYRRHANIDRKAYSDLNPDLSIYDADVFEVSKARFDPTTWSVVTTNGTRLALQATQQEGRVINAPILKALDSRITTVSVSGETLTISAILKADDIGPIGQVATTTRNIVAALKQAPYLVVDARTVKLIVSSADGQDIGSFEFLASDLVDAPVAINHAQALDLTDHLKLSALGANQALAFCADLNDSLRFCPSLQQATAQ